MADFDPAKLWELLKSSGTQTTLLVALIGQVTTGLIWQVKSNESQEAAIASNAKSLREFRDLESTMNTPFGQRFLAFETRIDELVKAAQSLQSPIGIRFVQLEATAQEAITQGRNRQIQIEILLNQLSDRLTLIDRRLLELETKAKEQKP